MTHEQLYQQLSALYPDSLSAAWDHDGIMVMKNGGQEVQKVLLALDCSNECAKRAIVGGYDLILTHHPLFFKPIGALVPENPLMARGLLLYEKGVSVFSFHTRLDCGRGGVNDRLAALLGLCEVTPFEADGLPMGRVGKLQEPLSGREFSAFLKERLGASAVFCNLPEKRVSTVAVLGGSGGDCYKDALLAGADCYVTGEASYHRQLDAAEAGLCLILCGHDLTEQPVLLGVKELLLTLCPEVQVDIFEKNQIRCL
jgi:dinuclear metal center YbgI/SA1388 family protein